MSPDKNPELMRSSSFSRIFLGWTGIVAILVVAVGAYWVYNSVPVAPKFVTPASMLRENNTAFAEGDALYLANDFKAAEAKYQEALPFAEGLAQEGQIRLRIAHTVRDQGQNIRAVRLYKDIVRNKEYPALTRAYAQQSIAVMADFIREDALREEIFTGEVYKKFLVPGNVMLSNRHLFEYAAYLYPLALSEIQVALWYADELRTNTIMKRGFSEEQIAEYRNIVTERMELASADMKRTSGDPNEAVLRPELLRARALTLSALYFAGYGLREEADRAYEDAYKAHAVYGAPSDGNMRMWYAYYLAGFEDRHDDLVAVIAPLYTNPSYRNSRIGLFLADERDNRLGAKKPLVLVASVDPKFKEFLVSLGWEESDFAAI